VRALNSVNTKLGFESGFIIVVVAILLDRMLKVTRK
jgi:glycine betaine/proline transport system permease protein